MYFHRMATDLRQSSAVAEQKSQLEEQGESPDDAVEDRGESQDTAVAESGFAHAHQRSVSSWYEKAECYEKQERKKKNTRRGNMRKRKW